MEFDILPKLESFSIFWFNFWYGHNFRLFSVTISYNSNNLLLVRVSAFLDRTWMTLFNLQSFGFESSLGPFTHGIKPGLAELSLCLLFVSTPLRLCCASDFALFLTSSPWPQLAPSGWSWQHHGSLNQSYPYFVVCPLVAAFSHILFPPGFVMFDSNIAYIMGHFILCQLEQVVSLLQLFLLFQYIIPEGDVACQVKDFGCRC